MPSYDLDESIAKNLEQDNAISHLKQLLHFVINYDTRSSVSEGVAVIQELYCIWALKEDKL